jgi:hypothetical protein
MVFVWLRCLGLEALTGPTLRVDTKPQRPSSHMRPFESLCDAILKLDNVCMCADSLMVKEKLLNFWSVEKKMVESPIHYKFVCGGWLKVSLRKAQYFVEISSDKERSVIIFYSTPHGTY